MSEPLKTCTRCGGNYPATAEYFNRTKATKLGLTAECKACLRQRVKAWQHNNRARVRAYGDRVESERRKQYSRTYRERKKARQMQHEEELARLRQVLDEKDKRIAELEAEADTRSRRMKQCYWDIAERNQRIAELEAQLPSADVLAAIESVAHNNNVFGDRALAVRQWLVLFDNPDPQPATPPLLDDVREAIGVGNTPGDKVYIEAARTVRTWLDAAPQEDNGE